MWRLVHLFLVDLEAEMVFEQKHKTSEVAGSRGAERKVTATAVLGLRKKRCDSAILHLQSLPCLRCYMSVLPLNPSLVLPVWQQASGWCSQCCSVLRLREAMRMLHSCVVRGARASTHALHLPGRTGKDVSSVISRKRQYLDSP